MESDWPEMGRFLAQIATRDWMDGPATALFPFGHGLSFTTFRFSDARLLTPLLAGE